MTLQLLTHADADAEPVTPAEARLAARFDSDALDDHIAVAITSAREQAEHITGRIYAVQTFRAELGDWPGAEDLIEVFQPTGCVIRYWTGNAFAVLDAAAYVYAASGVGTVVAPVIGGSWPALSARAAGPRVQIDVTAGLAPAVVPASVKLYIKAQVAQWLKNPEALVLNTLVASPTFDTLLDGQRLWA